jgi:uncharacterized membrane protein
MRREMGRRRMTSTEGRQAVRDAAKLLRSQDFDTVLRGRALLADVLLADTTPGVLLDAAHLALYGTQRDRRGSQTRD